jgi:WD40-like Beta Propeller Repeat
MRLASMLAVLAATAFGAVGSADASYPATKGRLVLLSEGAGFASPSLVREDGGPLPIGLPLGIHGSAAMSPDGTEIAMVDTVPFLPGLTPPTLLVGDLIESISDLAVGPVAGRPTWSPDGTRIAFAGNRNGNWDIFVVGATEGPGAVPVDLTPASPAADLEPRWSPDARRSPSRATAAATSTSTR